MYSVMFESMVVSWVTLSQDDLQHMHDVIYTYSVVVLVMAGSQECT